MLDMVVSQIREQEMSCRLVIGGRWIRGYEEKRKRKLGQMGGIDMIQFMKQQKRGVKISSLRIADPNS